MRLHKIFNKYFPSVFSSFALVNCAPKPQALNDDDDDDDGLSANEIIPKFIHQSLDYNAMVNHFKDFFMYLPVMFTTLKETMSGFPKFAEGVKILTSGITPNMAEEEQDCKCKPQTTETEKRNDIERITEYN